MSLPPKSKPPKRDTAIALAFDPAAGDQAPRVTASGKGALAREILDLAFAAGIKVREDQELAELLAAIDVESVIPAEAMVAVAEILTYVYRANGRMAAGASS